MKKISIVALLVAALFATVSMLNAQTPSPAEPFPVATEGFTKACCAKKTKCEKEKCDLKECDGKKCEKKKCEAEKAPKKCAAGKCGGK